MEGNTIEITRNYANVVLFLKVPNTLLKGYPEGLWPSVYIDNP